MRYWLIIMLLLPGSCFAQGYIGVLGGAGMCTSGDKGILPVCEFEYMYKTSGRPLVGTYFSLNQLLVQENTTTVKTGQPPDYSYMHQHSRWLLFGSKIDVGIGQRLQIFRFTLSFGGTYLISGRQTTIDRKAVANVSGTYHYMYDTLNTSSQIYTLGYTMSIGFEQRIPVSKRIGVRISEEITAFEPTLTNFISIKAGLTYHLKGEHRKRTRGPD